MLAVDALDPALPLPAVLPLESITKSARLDRFEPRALECPGILL